MQNNTFNSWPKALRWSNRKPCTVWQYQCVFVVVTRTLQDSFVSSSRLKSYYCNSCLTHWNVRSIEQNKLHVVSGTTIDVSWPTLDTSTIRSLIIIFYYPVTLQYHTLNLISLPTAQRPPGPTQQAGSTCILEWFEILQVHAVSIILYVLLCVYLVGRRGASRLVTAFKVRGQQSVFSIVRLAAHAFTRVTHLLWKQSVHTSKLLEVYGKQSMRLDARAHSPWPT